MTKTYLLDVREPTTGAVVTSFRLACERVRIMDAIADIPDALFLELLAAADIRLLSRARDFHELVAARGLSLAIDRYLEELNT
jgi:hypothetical protein